MAPTAVKIVNVTFSGEILAGFPQLIVEFQVLTRGPFHVAGLILTEDSWKHTQVVDAVFQRFGTISLFGTPFEVEFWHAEHIGPRLGIGESRIFEFVVFCDDFGGADSVPRIWDTNRGNPYQFSFEVAQSALGNAAQPETGPGGSPAGGSPSCLRRACEGAGN
jgi:hypothetical protein